MLSLAADAEHLPRVRDRGQVVERGDAFDGAGVPAAVKRLLRQVGEAPLRIPFPVCRLQGLEGLRQFQRMTVCRLPVVTQAAGNSADKPAARNREGARFRKQQLAGIARHKVQPLNLLRRLPADEPVSRIALQRACPPGQPEAPAGPQHTVARIPQDAGRRVRSARPSDGPDEGVPPAVHAVSQPPPPRGSGQNRACPPIGRPKMRCPSPTSPIQPRTGMRSSRPPPARPRRRAACGSISLESARSSPWSFGTQSTRALAGLPGEEAPRSTPVSRPRIA